MRTHPCCPDRVTRAARLTVLVVLLLALVGLDLPALALPRDPAPPASLRPAGPSEMLVAQRRRRHARPARPRPRPKAATKVSPKAEPVEEPAAPAAPGGAAAGAAGDPNNLQRGGRVEFDGRLVQGQTAKSGAIYLFARQRTDLQSMVRERDSYRREVLRTVYPDRTR